MNKSALNQMKGKIKENNEFLCELFLNESSLIHDEYKYIMYYFDNKIVSSNKRSNMLCFGRLIAMRSKCMVHSDTIRTAMKSRLVVI